MTPGTLQRGLNRERIKSGDSEADRKRLGLPLSIEKATEVLASGKVADVDLGKVNGDYFANTAALGLSAGVARSMPHLLKRCLGKAGYLLVGAKRFLAHRPFRFRLVQDDRAVELLALDVLIANGRYHGGVLVAPDAGVETRDLVVQVVKGETKWNLVKAWIHLGLLSFETLPHVAVILTKDAVIDTTPEQYVSIDGEVITQTPVRISVAYEALRLIVPQEFEDSDDIECD